MKKLNISILIVLLVILSTSCKKAISEDNLFIAIRAHIPEAHVCRQYNIKERTAIGERTKTAEKDTVSVISFNENGNILLIDFYRRGTIEYQYRDSLLVEEKEYSYWGDLQGKILSSYLSRCRIDSVYDARHLYAWSKAYLDECGRDTAVYRFTEEANWIQDSKETTMYDDLGFKKSIFKDNNGYVILTKRINDDPYKHIIQHHFGSDSLILEEIQETEVIVYNDKRQTYYKSDNSSIKEHDMTYKTEYYENGLAKKDVYYDKNNEIIYELTYTYQYY